MRAEQSLCVRNDSLVVDAPRLAKLLGVSVRHIRHMDSVETLPAAVRIGGEKVKRWVIEEIQAWLKAGSPDRAGWELKKQKGEQ